MTQPNNRPGCLDKLMILFINLLAAELILLAIYLIIEFYPK